MSNPRSNIREKGLRTDEEQGRGTDLLLIHNRLVFTLFLESVDDHNYSLPQQEQDLPGESNLSDGSEALFSMYLRRAREEDREMVESWRGYAGGMLVFVSLRAPSDSSRIM